MKRVLFVCIESSIRSQMAEAFARMYGGEDIQAFSAVAVPSEPISPTAIRFMSEIGYDLSRHIPKSLGEIDGEFDAVVTMGADDSCLGVKAKRREKWELRDPKLMDDIGCRVVRNEISQRVKALLNNL